MKKLLYILVLIPFISLSQTKQEVESATGSEKAGLSIQYASKNITADTKYCIEILQESYDYGKKNNQEQIKQMSGLLLCKAYYENKEYAKALSIGEPTSNEMSSSDKNYPTLISLLGSTALKLGDTKKSILYLEKAYDITPNGDKAMEIATAHSKAKDYKTAISWYDKALSAYTSDKDKTTAIISKALTLGNYGDNKTAQKLLNDAMPKASAEQKKLIEGYLKDLEQNSAAQESAQTGYVADKTQSLEDLAIKAKNLNAKSLAEIEMLSETMQLVEFKIKAQADDFEKQLLQEKAQTAQANQKLQQEKAEKEKVLIENELIKTKEIATQTELANKQLTITLLITLAAGLFAIGLLLFRSITHKKRTTLELRKQNQEIQEQNDLIMQQNNNIRESLDYAMQIQSALLPSREKFFQSHERAFIMHKPKDFVSGDFFWHHKEDNKLFIAIADCTGHGVPGAFMTIICSAILEKVVKEGKEYLPHRILEKTTQLLTEKIRENLGDEEFKGGMDISLACVDYTNNKLLFSGARNPLYVVRHNQLVEYKGTRRSVAVTNRTVMPFELHEIQLKVDDHIYMFSDGFPDQKGGPEGKKFYYKPFQELLTKLPNGNEIDYQQEALSDAFDLWKGKKEQYDDVLVVGIEISDNSEDI